MNTYFAQIARTDRTEFQTGKDGKYYRMLDKKDWNKYHILSETEEAEEILKSQEIRENMLTMSGHVKNGHLSRTKSSGIKVIAPQIGTANSSRRKDTIKWERELNMANSTGKTMKGSSFQSTIAKLEANTEQEDEDEDEPAVDEESSPVYDYTSIADSARNNKSKQAFDIIQKKYEQNLHVVDKLYQEKMSLEEYTKSLEVELMKVKGIISKKTPTRYPPPTATQELLLDIPSRQENNSPEYDEEEDEDDVIHVEEHRPDMISNVRKPHRSQYDPSHQHHQQQQQQRRTGTTTGQRTEKKLSAADAAKLFASTDHRQPQRYAPRKHANEHEDEEVVEEEDEEEEEGRHHPRLGRSRSTDRFASSQRPSSANALHRFSVGIVSATLRSSSAPRNPWRHSYHGDTTTHRSLTPTESVEDRRSVSSSGRKVTGLSLQLQADQDRFLQKRKFIEQQEKLKQKEQDEYEKYLEERSHRASAMGKAFTSMEERQLQVQKQLDLRDAKKKAKERDERRKQKAIQDEIDHKKLQAMKEALYSHDQMPWKEMQEQEDALRRERIERRKQELASTASLPQSMEEHMNQMKLKKSLSESKIRAMENSKNQRSEKEEPEKVTERLLKQRQQWEQKLAMEKAKTLEQQHLRHVADGAVISKTGGSSSRPNSARKGSLTPRDGGGGPGGGGMHIVRPKLSIEKRHEQFMMKSQQKQLDREQKEKEEIEKQKELERKKYEKLLTTKLPDNAYRGTKASKLKHSVVAKAQQDEKRQKEQEEKKQHEKTLALKESGAVMKFLIKERMEDLKTKNPNYMELVSTEQVAKERAKREKADYAEKLRTNKQRLEESLKARPSLLERHDKSIAVKQATTAGLMKIAQVLEGGDNDEFGFGNISDSEDEKDQKAKKDKGKGKNAVKKNAPSSAKLKDDLFDDKEKTLLGMNS